jgi:hypothetical protein
MPIRARWLTLALLVGAFGGLEGCTTDVSTNPDDYVGEYVFQPADTDPGAFASFVYLRKDHTAVEVRISHVTGQLQTTEEPWYLSRTTSENVVIGKFSHPIEHSHSAISLGINDDLGESYEKVR